MQFKPNQKRYLGTGLFLVYLSTQVIFSHAIETNFWAERRRASPHQEFARLPQNFRSLPQQILKQLPSIEKLSPLPLNYGSIQKTTNPSQLKKRNKCSLDPRYSFKFGGSKQYWGVGPRARSR
jgi:hypothetical protein